MITQHSINRTTFQHSGSLRFFLALLFLAGSLSVIGCSDTIMPSGNDDKGSDTTDVVDSGSAASIYPFLYMMVNQQEGTYSYRSTLEESGLVQTYGAIISHAPTAQGRAIVGDEDQRLKVIDLATGTDFSPIFTASSGTQFGNSAFALSPDGNRIAWTEEFGGADNERQTVLVNVDGTERVTIPVGAAHENFLRFSPDGTYLAFLHRDYVANTLKLYRVNVDGTDLKVLTELNSTIQINDGYGAFDWSPDGSKIVYADGTSLSELNVINVDGTGKKTVAYGFSPDWSPDGSTIVFTDLNNYHLAAIKSDGTGDIEQLTQAVSVAPRWSPDGRHILYAEYDQLDDAESSNARIRVLNYSTRNATTISTEGSRFGLYWSDVLYQVE